MTEPKLNRPKLNNQQVAYAGGFSSSLGSELEILSALTDQMTAITRISWKTNLPAPQRPPARRS